MPSNIELEGIYSKITVCNKRCEGIQNEPATGIMGRSFYCPFDVSDTGKLAGPSRPVRGSKMTPYYSVCKVLSIKGSLIIPPAPL